MSGEPIVLTALMWAWTNALGRLPDGNTMTEAEIQNYRLEYEQILRTAIRSITGDDPV